MDVDKKETKTKLIDVRGGKLISAYVLVKVVNVLRTIEIGDSIEVVTDVFDGLKHDIEAWSRLSGHHVVLVDDKDGQAKETNCHRYRITKVKEEKKEEHIKGNNSNNKVAIVISKDGLDELISPLGFALAAITSGMDVYLYFQGPGVYVLKHNFLGQLPGCWTPFSCFARRGMAAMGHAYVTDKMEQLHQLGAHFYACHPSLKVFKVKQSDLAFPNDVILAEYVTFLEVMKDASIQMYP